MVDKAMKLMRNFSVAGFVAAVAVGMFIPVYTDEIGWRYQERAGFDGVDKLYSDICGPNTLAQPPWFMMPVRYYSAFFNGAFADPAYVRLSGVVYALVLASLAFLVIRRAAGKDRDRLLLTTLGFGLIGTGMTPLLAVWSRPEQPILLSALAAMAIALRPRPPAGQSAGDGPAWLPVLAVVALWAIAVSYHLKGLFLLPVFGVCLFHAGTGRNPVAPRVAGMVLLLAITASATSYWLGRLACPQSAILRASFAGNSIGAELLEVSTLEQARALVMKMFGNISFVDYVLHTAPSTQPMSDWLPRHQISYEMGLTWFVVMLIIWGLASLAGLAALGAALKGAIKEHKLNPRLLLSLACLITLAGWGALQNISNPYEAPFFCVLLMLSITFALAASGLPPRMRGMLEAFTSILAILTLANPVLLASVWGPAMARAFDQTGYIEGQPFSVSLRGYGKLRQEIRQTARMCGIPEPGKARGLLIDDVTYFAFMESSLPQHRLGVLSDWNGEITDPVAYLKSRNSDGMIVGCHFLDKGLRARARQHGHFCCLAPPAW